METPNTPALTEPILATSTTSSVASSPLSDSPPSPTLPLPLSQSILLANLPHDATAALSSAGTFPFAKVTVRFKAVGSAPPLRQPVCRIGAEARFESVVSYLRRVLAKAGGGEKDEGGGHVFCYVNSSFAPGLDEVVGNLFVCFKDSSDQLIVAYSMTPAFG